VSDPAGRARPWAGRSYAHLILPTPYLAPAHLTALDAAVTAADDWRRAVPAAGPAGVPLLGVAWQRGTGRRAATLRLAVLGWYPLLVTAGVDRADPAGRRALRRLVAAATRAGARPVPDTELPARVAAAPDRWRRAATLLAEAADHATTLTTRDCRTCDVRSLHAATHCQGCGRRFTTLDDQSRDEHASRARAALTTCRNTVLTLHTDLSPPPDPPPTDSTPTEPVPADSVPTEPGLAEATPTEATPTEATPTEAVAVESVPAEGGEG
jgi:hypothetical protein